MRLAEAEALAAEILALLDGTCERRAIVGSVRRRKPEPHDIEILCVPIRWPREDLFANVVGWDSALEDRVARLLAEGVLTARLDRNGQRAIGKRYKRLSYRGAALDLFCVIEPAQWGVLSVIRTGPAEFSQQVVTRRSRQAYAPERPGLLPDHLFVREGALWEIHDNWDWLEPVPTPEESDFFRCLGLDYIPPEERR